MVESVKRLVTPSLEKRKIWQGIRAEPYGVIRKQVEQLVIPEYREIALSALAEVVALTESGK